jgi:heat shock protein HslJ
MRKFLAPVLLLFFAFSCKSLKKVSSPEEIGGKWMLVSIPGTEGSSLQEHRQPFLLLNSKEKKYSGNNSCNSISGELTFQTDSIRFLPGISTKMFCQHSLEEEFMSRLHRINSYKLENNQLHFYHSGQPLFVFEKSAQ